MPLFDSNTLSHFRRLHGAASPLLPPAAGREMSGWRDYTPGDDLCSIDWTLCARRDELLTRCFTGQEDRRFYLLIDCSRSMALGEPSKFDVARRVAGLLGFLALRRENAVAAAGFSDRPLADRPPLRGAANRLHWLRFCAEMTIDLAPTNLVATAEAYVRRRQRPGPIVVLSDFYDPRAFPLGLAVLQEHGYQPRAVQVVDPSEADAPPAGEIELADVESADRIELTLTQTMRREFRTAYHDRHERLRLGCRQRGWPCVPISTAWSWGEICRAVLSHASLRGTVPIFAAKEAMQR